MNVLRLGLHLHQPLGGSFQLVQRMVETSWKPVENQWKTRLSWFTYCTASTRGRLPQVIPIQWLHEVIFGQRLVPAWWIWWIWDVSKSSVNESTPTLLVILQSVCLDKSEVNYHEKSLYMLTMIVGGNLYISQFCGVLWQLGLSLAAGARSHSAASPKNPLRRLSKQAIEVLSGANNMNQYSWAHGYLLMVIE